jgi:hypothetical protein
VGVTDEVRYGCTVALRTTGITIVAVLGELDPEGESTMLAQNFVNNYLAVNTV